MFHILDQPIQQSGGMMTLTDAFVRVNRARGLELVSPGNYNDKYKTNRSRKRSILYLYSLRTDHGNLHGEFD